MKRFWTQIGWQFKLLQKNSIISVSLAVTLIYGLILFFLRSVEHLDKVLVALVLNDPSVIGYFFIALAIYTEIKHQILPALFVTPVELHQFLIARILSISLLGLVCSLGLAISVRGFDLNIPAFVLGASGICLLSALLGLIMLTFAPEFLKFTMLSVPVFLIFINLPLLQYLGVLELGIFRYLFPIQGSLELIEYSISGGKINFWYTSVSMLVGVLLFYGLAYRLFDKKIVHEA